jgi:hypothetical protein
MIASETQDMVRKVLDVFKSCNVVLDNAECWSFSLKHQLGFANFMQSNIVA